MSSMVESLAQDAYEAHRAVLPAPGPPWEDITKEEQQAWMAAVSVIADKTGVTIAEAAPSSSLILQVGDQRLTFRADFTAGREGRLAIDDGFASGRHARFLTVRGLWYVEDLDSTNGTVLNGRRIHGPQVLRKRDKIKIGHTVVVVVSL
jgi:pSer/pThr/pTyr-binding forkhead associated (FHA) protein